MSDEETTDDVKTMYKDTPTGDTDSENQGVGVSPLPIDGDEADDPKSGGTPVHKAPSEDSPQS